MQRTEMCIRFLIHHPFDYDPLVYPSLILYRVKISYSNRVIYVHVVLLNGKKDFEC
jgi:hypothetical protein